MEENEMVYERLRTIKDASDKIAIESVLSAIVSRMELEIRPDIDVYGQPFALPKEETSAEDTFARKLNAPAFFFQQGKHGLAISFRQYMNDVSRLAGWLQRWDLQGGRVVIATHNAYGQSVALFASMAAGCPFSVFSLLSRRDALETFLWEQQPAALICGRREAETGKRYRENHDLKILQMSDNAENGLVTVCI